mgnify:CR=1 FL=1
MNNLIVKLLLVSNDYVVDSMLSEVFSNKNFEMKVYNTFFETRLKLKTKDFSLIIINDDMLSDESLFSFVLEFSSKYPIVIITDKDDSENIEKYFKIGISDYFVKPLNLKLFWPKVKKILDDDIQKNKSKEESKLLGELMHQHKVEESIAYYVYNHMIGEENKPDFLSSYTLSADNFSGDIQLHSISPSGAHYILLADATGHGLAAAISVFPLASIFKSMISKGHSAEMVLEELNSKLSDYIPPDRFISAVLVEIDLYSQQLKIWNGGMPTVTIYSDNMEIINESISENMALGILEDNKFKSNLITTMLPKNGFLFMYSDGLTEQCNKEGEEFGEDRVFNKIKTSNVTDLIENVMDESNSFRGNQAVSDDISICVIDFGKI